MPVHSCERAPTWAGDGGDEDERLQAECLACQADRARARAIARWEDEPLDPEEDLGWLEDYARELDHLREEQDAMKRSPVYKIANLIGGSVREGFLRLVADGGWWQADEFFTAEVCACDPLGEGFSDGRPVYSWHRKADRCRWCVLRERLEWTAHCADLARWSGRPLAEVEAEVAAADEHYRTHCRGWAS